MTSLRSVLLFQILLLTYVNCDCSTNITISESLKQIFLSGTFNTAESEWILRSGRESYQLLKEALKETGSQEKLRFVRNYADFLVTLFQNLETKYIDIYYIFMEQKQFLREKQEMVTGNVNITQVKQSFENIMSAVEQILVPYHNSSKTDIDIPELFSKNDTCFDAFLMNKLRSDYSEFGYFFLEVFATLIGLSWGLISTVLHVSMSGSSY